MIPLSTPSRPGHPAMDPESSFGPFVKEMIVNRLPGAANAPLLAAEIVKRTAAAGAAAARARGLSPKETVATVCFAALCGLLLIDEDLPQCAVGILSGLAELAPDLELDPAELMTWGLEGIARAAALAPRRTELLLAEALEEKFHGVGEVFDRLRRRHEKARDGFSTGGPS